jgi:hypothetical protein
MGVVRVATSAAGPSSWSASVRMTPQPINPG